MQFSKHLKAINVYCKVDNHLIIFEREDIYTVFMQYCMLDKELLHLQDVILTCIRFGLLSSHSAVSFRYINDISMITCYVFMVAFSLYLF